MAGLRQLCASTPALLFRWENKEKTLPGSGIWHYGVRMYKSKDLYNWEDVGLVLPPVEGDKDSVGTIYAGVPSIDTKSIKTQVLVENGGTVVIGGIFEQTQEDDVSKVPFLGDVPYLGNLFKTKTTSSTRTEMLIFLTPKVVSDRTAVR